MDQAVGKKSPVDALLNEGFFLRLWGASALDNYLGLGELPFVFAETNAGLADLTRFFGELRFPGAPRMDAAVEFAERTWYFNCLDMETAALGTFRPAADTRSAPADHRFSCGPAYAPLDFYRDLRTGAFLDPRSRYSLLRALRKGAAAPWLSESGNSRIDRFGRLGEAALILSRYDTETEPLGSLVAELKAAGPEAGEQKWPAPSPEAQRVLLSLLLLSARPDRGLELLKAAGFLAAHWPELVSLDRTEHSKEFHPEGNAWRHTMETFRYRKPAASGIQDLRLSLGLLLHDTGKPLSESAGGRRFDGHAELGAGAAKRFLERLGFSSGMTDDVCYLVKNHMLPAALPVLPESRTGEVMASPLFPTLMELYRCDESSSFKGLDGYYQSSAAYRKFLRRRKNPYR